MKEWLKLTRRNESIDPFLGFGLHAALLSSAYFICFKNPKAERRFDNLRYISIVKLTLIEYRGINNLKLSFLDKLTDVSGDDLRCIQFLLGNDFNTTVNYDELYYRRLLDDSWFLQLSTLLNLST